VITEGLVFPAFEYQLIFASGWQARENSKPRFDIRISNGGDIFGPSHEHPGDGNACEQLRWVTTVLRAIGAHDDSRLDAVVSK